MPSLSSPPTTIQAQATPSPSIGLRASLGQIGLLALVSAFVGGMVGLERTILPVVAQSNFGIASNAAAIAFIATFGLSKAAINLFVGPLSDRFGRRSCLLVGWLFGLPVPLLIMAAPDWSWVLFANILLGVNQALTWSMTLNMKIDLAAPHERGRVIGLNEFAGYVGLAAVAFLTGLVAEEYGLRPVPFYLGVGLAIAGLALSLLVSNTRAGEQSRGDGPPVPFGKVLLRGSGADANLSVASLAGLVTNLKDGMLWGLLPILLKARGLSIAEIGLVAALYPTVWGVAQLATGSLSDIVSRKAISTVGLALQGLGVWAFVWTGTYPGYLFAAVLTGLGTALVYPTLQAIVADAAAPAWRASTLGVYRFWRDLGYVFGALGAGAVADALGISQAFTMFALLAALAGITFALKAGHTHPEGTS